MVVVVLSRTGDQVPVYPLIEVVGKGDKLSPLQIGATAENVGVILGFTVILRVAGVAH
jgi:hypothetical protein